MKGTRTGRRREIQIDGELDAANGALDVAVTANGLDLTPELFANLPDSVGRQLAGIDVAGQANVTLHLVRADASVPPSWSSKFNVERGRFVHQMLPEPLTEISLSGQADPQHLSVERLTAKCGPATILLAVNRAGWSENAPLALSAKVVGYALTERLETTLPESYARIWQRFRPIGTVDADVQATFDEKRGWKPTLVATCRGISLTDIEKFNYVLEQTTGKVIYRPAGEDGPDQLHLDLTGVGGGRPVKIDAHLTHVARAEPQGPAIGEGVASEQPTKRTEVHAAGYRGIHYARAGHAANGHPLGYVELSGSDIPLHDRLLAALPEKAKELVGALQAEGAIDFRFRAEWKDLRSRMRIRRWISP